MVTGGNSGIGLGIARACAEAGADVAIWGTDEAKNARARAELEVIGTRVLAQRCDVGDEPQVVETFAAAVDELGKIDCLFANAGVGASSPFVDMTLEEWRAVMRVNLDGAFLSLREAARHMVARGEGGSLVGMSSTSAIHGAPRLQHYAASKTAMLAIMRGLAVELARYRIRCNSMLPGWTTTPMNEPGRRSEKFVRNTTERTPVRRWADPSDMGPAAVFLADPTYLFHTGDELVVDGGYTRY
ncbi:MAG: SDR family oxidoreductase [Actinobacteria bacterium]|nr:SDR family oxidoreductase [Actinomycetota bacterium]